MIPPMVAVMVLAGAVVIETLDGLEHCFQVGSLPRLLTGGASVSLKTIPLGCLHVLTTWQLTSPGIKITERK